MNYTDDNGTWTIRPMTNIEDNIWNGTLAPYPHGTNVTYTIIAKDSTGNQITTEELYGQPNQYQVLPEFPSLVFLSLILTATIIAITCRRKLPKNKNSNNRATHICSLIEVHC